MTEQAPARPGSARRPTVKEVAQHAGVSENVANEFSVEKFRDGYLMVTHDTSELFSTRVVAKVGCSPTGPFAGDTELFRTPATGAAGTYGDADVFTYNAHAHCHRGPRDRPQNGAGSSMAVRAMNSSTRRGMSR